MSQEVGASVRVQWTREDGIQHGYYHATSVDWIEAAVDADGKVTGLLHRVVAPTIMSLFMEDPGYLADWENGMGHTDLPFDVSAIRCENGEAKAHARIGWWRSVNNVPRAFAMQSFVAELADELGRITDGLSHRRRPARKRADHRCGRGGLRPAAAGRRGDRPRGASQLCDLCGCRSAGAGRGRAHGVPEIHMGIDCGFAANPERIRSQMEGAAVMGMTLALHSGITFEEGAVIESNFSDYQMVRSDNFPRKVTTHIVAHPFSVPAAGVGEPGVPPVAPAIANGIFFATGQRLRNLPIGEAV